MKIFCRDLRDQAMKTINYEKKEMIPLTNEEEEGSYENQDICYTCEKEFCTNKNNKKEFKSNCKVRDHCHYTKNIEELLIVVAIYAIKYQKRFL